MENSGSIGAQTLTMAGTHTIVVNPMSYAVGNITLTHLTVPATTLGVPTSGRPR